MAMIRTDALSVGYDKKILIDGISIELREGQILTLIGPNGCGKSTILKSITRQLDQLGGTVYLDGNDMKTMRDSQVSRLLSMVMTERPRPELMTCKEVIATGRYPYTGRMGILSGEDWRKVDEAIARFQVEPVQDTDYNRISDGQRQRVMLARAFCQEPKVLVLDEPTSFLDMRYKIDILKNIRKMARENGMTIVMSLHELDLARIVSDRILCVSGDHAVRWGSPDEIFADGFIQELYGVPRENYNVQTGAMSLGKTEGEPKLFIIGGGGTAISSFYQCQRDGEAFATGILTKNDVEYAIAVSMSDHVVAAEEFELPGEVQLAQAKSLIDRCEACVCTVQKFGEVNRLNEQLKLYAKERGKLIWQK